MTANQLAKELGVSRAWLFALRKKFPLECPKTFADAGAWRVFLTATRMQTKVRSVQGTGNAPRGSNIARLTKARADKTETQVKILAIELDATRREVICREDVIALFAQIKSVARARLVKMGNDLPAALVGLDAPAISRVVTEKIEHALSYSGMSADFFAPH